MGHGENTSSSRMKVGVEYNSREFSDVTVIYWWDIPTQFIPFLHPNFGRYCGWPFFTDECVLCLLRQAKPWLSSQGWSGHYFKTICILPSSFPSSWPMNYNEMSHNEASELTFQEHPYFSCAERQPTEMSYNDLEQYWVKTREESHQITGLLRTNEVPAI